MPAPTWQSAAFPVGYNASTVLWASARSKFVALAINGAATGVFTSPDGTSWTLVGSIPGYSIMAYSPSLDLFVASDGANISRSSDLTSWTTVVTGAVGGLNLLTWDSVNAQFITVPGSSATGIGTSGDGTTWTFHAGPYTDDGADTLYGIICTGLSTMMLFMNDASDPTNSPKAYTSTTGVTWAASAFSFAPPGGGSIFAQGGHYYVGGQQLTGSNASGVADYNGTTWAFTSIYPTTGGIFSSPYVMTYVAKVTSGYVVPAWDNYPTGIAGVWTSDDNVTWTFSSATPINLWFGGANSSSEIVLTSFVDNNTITTASFAAKPPCDLTGLRRATAIRVSQNKGQPNTCSFSLGNPDGSMLSPMPAVGQDVQMDFGDGFGLLFGGTVQTAELQFDGKTSAVSFNIFAADYQFRLNRRRPFGCFNNQSLTTVIAYLVTNFGGGEFTDLNVDSGLPPVTAIFDGSLLFSQCMDQICGSAGCVWGLYGQDIYTRLIPTP